MFVCLRVFIGSSLIALLLLLPTLLQSVRAELLPLKSYTWPMVWRTTSSIRS